MWDKYCDKIFTIEKECDWSKAIVFDLNGKTAVQFSTAHGDGCYPVDDGNKIIGKCGVDAGLLSFLPVDDEVLAAELVKRGDCGVFVDLNAIFEYSNPKGDARVGNILVTTGGGFSVNEKDYCPLCGDHNDYCGCDPDKIHAYFDKQ